MPRFCNDFACDEAEAAVGVKTTTTDSNTTNIFLNI
jgi:hypothetical protein